MSGYPLDDQLDIVTGQPDPAPLSAGTGGGDVHLSGDPRCALDDTYSFLESLGPTSDSSADWVAAKTGFSTSGKDLAAHGGRRSKDYEVDDTLSNTNETNTITLARTVTVSARGG